LWPLSSMPRSSQVGRDSERTVLTRQERLTKLAESRSLSRRQD
jgi:hypothetical protein